MSDEHSAGQDAPTARPSLSDAAAWLEGSAQPAPSDEADPAPEEAAGPPEAGSPGDGAGPEDATEPPADAGDPAAAEQHDRPPSDASEQPAAPLTEQADTAETGAQDSPALAVENRDIELAAPPMAGVDAHDSGLNEALPGRDDPSAVEDEAPPLEAQGGAGADFPSPPGLAEAGETGPSSDDAAPASEPEELADGGTDRSDEAAPRYPPAPPVSAVIWSPEPAPDPADDDGPVEAGEADDPGSAALFELDLAKLAERARASARGEAAPYPEPDAAPDLILDPLALSAPPSEPSVAPPPDPFPDLVTASSAADDEPGQSVAPEPEPLVWGDATQAFDLSRDEEAEDEADSTEVPAATASPEGEVAAPVRPAPRTRRAERPAYPRGQLREPIGILRRVRAMLGILVVTVLLGVAAGTAVGAFIFFLAFAVRSAITSQ